jgi:uncharacterized repeat protein (TIGR01451 family)
MLTALIIITLVTGLTLPILPGAGSDPVARPTCVLHHAVWSFNGSGEYELSDAVLGQDGARLASYPYVGTTEFSDPGTGGKMSGSTAGLHDDSLSLSYTGVTKDAVFNVTNVFKGPANVTSFVVDDDETEIQLVLDEYMEVQDIEEYTHLNTMTYLNMSIVINSNTYGAAVAIQIDTGSGWSEDLNTSSTDIAYTTYWISLDSNGVDTKNGFNDLRVRIYCRDPNNDGGVPERIRIDEVKFWSDHVSPGDLIYDSEGSYVSPVLDGGSKADLVWDSASWNGSATGAGTTTAVQVRTGDVPTPDETWSPWSADLEVPAGSSLGAVSSGYIQYRVTLGTLDSRYTPLITNVTLVAHCYEAAGSAETADLEVTDLVSWDWVSANGSLNGGDIEYRFSVDSGLSWTNLFNYQGGLNAIPSDTGKVRFMALLSSPDQGSTPVVHNITMCYSTMYEPTIAAQISSSSSVRPGDTVNIQVTLNNTGNAPGANATIILTKPAEFLFVGDDFGVEPSIALKKVTWEVGDVEPGVTGSSIDLEVPGGLPDGTLFKGLLELEYENYKGQPMPTSISTELTWDLRAPVLNGTLEADASTIRPEGTVNFTLALVNDGRDDARDIEVATSLPEGLLLQAANPSPSYQFGNELSWNLTGAIGPGGEWGLRIRAWASPDILNGTVMATSFRAEYQDRNQSASDPFVTGAVKVTAEVPEPPVEQSPRINGTVPDLQLEEDSPPGYLNLTGYEEDLQDKHHQLRWYATGENNSLYRLTGENSTADSLRFTPLPDAYGDDLIRLHLTDSDGNQASTQVWVNVTPVNDAPVVGDVPDLNVRYLTPYTFNLSFYIGDVETPDDALLIGVSDPEHVTVDGTSISLTYSRKYTGQTRPLELTVSDGELSSSTSINVTISDNFAPTAAGEQLPRIMLTGSQILMDAFDLDDHFTDPDGDTLTYECFGNHRVVIVIGDDGMVDVQAPADWSGVELIGFRATDRKGAVAETFTTVTVVTDNVPPRIEGLPDIQVRPGTQYLLDLAPYVTDTDTVPEDLLVTSNRTANVWADPAESLLLVFDFPPASLGMNLQTTIEVSDGFASSGDTMSVRLTSNPPPELLGPVPDIEFSEDELLGDALDPDEHFVDDRDGLTYQLIGLESINSAVGPDGVFSLWAEPDWYGSESVVLRAVDKDGALKEDPFTVTVAPVNDAPVLLSLPALSIEKGEATSIDLREYCHDIDDDFSSLAFGTDTPYVIVVGSELIFTGSRDTPGLIFLNVTDGELGANITIEVNVVDSDEQAKAEEPEPVLSEVGGGVKYVFLETTQFIRDYSYAILAIITAVFLALLVFVYRTVYEVKEVFLVHQEKGVVINYLSHTDAETFEKDMLGSMLTVFQTFVEDAYNQGDAGNRTGKKSSDELSLKQFSISDDMKVMIEVTDNLYLALIYEGAETRLRMRVKRTLRKMEANYGDVLKDWSGDMDDLKGTGKILESLLTTPISKDVLRNFGKDVEVIPEEDVEVETGTPASRAPRRTRRPRTPEDAFLAELDDIDVEYWETPSRAGSGGDGDGPVLKLPSGAGPGDREGS